MSTTMANRATVTPKWYVIDAADQVVGRLAVLLAINADKVQFTGRKWEQKEYQTYSHYAGGQKIIPAKTMLAKKPEEIIRLAVKRMMPRGPLAYKQITKLKIYAGTQHPHQAQQPSELKLNG